MKTKILKLVFVLIGISLNFSFYIPVRDLGEFLIQVPELGFYYLAIYFGYMVLLLSPLGDFWINLTIGARQPTHHELKRLNALRANLANSAVSKRIPFPETLKLLIMTEPYPNAMAYGQNMVAFTTGLLKSFGDDEIEGVMAHEIGHIVNRDNISDLLVAVSFGPALWVGRQIIDAIIFGIAELEMIVIVLGLVLAIFLMPCTIAALIFKLFEFIEAFLSRDEEFAADKYAVKLAGRDGLVGFLQQIEHLDTVPHGDFLAAYTASHPPTLVRIDHIEQQSA